MSDLNGKSVGGYPIQKLLNKGAYVEVYQAATSGAPVTVRVLREDLRSNKALSAEIIKGWDSAKGIAHANLVTVYNTGSDAEAGVFSLEEYVSGKSLRQMMLGGPKVAWRDCLILAEQLFGAIATLHAAGKIHGDIWSGNIILTQDQDLKLEGAGGLTQTRSAPTEILEGPSIGYLAPEVVSGSPLTFESDLYAAGAVLHFIIAGQDPYPGEDSGTIARAVLDRKPAPLSALRDDVPPEAEAFIARLMAKDPTQRYGTAADVLADVNRMKSGQHMGPLKGGRPAAAPKKASQSAPAVSPPSGHKDAAKDSRHNSGGALKATGSQNFMNAATSQGILSAVKGGSSGGRVFGRLETHVKSTIPQSDTEKRGDDFYRQGQLPLALAAWKDAFTNATPHAGLKVKIELAEKDVKKEAFTSALDEARHRLLIGDSRGAISKAREAILAAENDQQKQEAVRLETEALQKTESAAQGNNIKMAAMAVGFIILVIIVFKMMGGKKEEPEVPQLPPEVIVKKGVNPAEDKKDSRFPIQVAGALVTPPQPWTTSGANLVVPAGDGKPAATMTVSASAGLHSAKLQELRAGTGMANFSKLDDLESFMYVDGTFPVSELGFRYTGADNQTNIRYYYIINGPSERLYIAQFEGQETAFTGSLRGQMRQIIQSWTYRKK
jgi:serine/threonine protein kinase